MLGVTGGLRATAVALACVVVGLIAPAPASADHGAPPWASGPDVDSALETAAAQAVSELIVKRPVRVRCHSEEEWVAANAPLGWDPMRIAGFAEIGGGVANLSPITCADLDEFWNYGATEKRCRTMVAAIRTKTTTVPVQVRTRVRVRVNGRWRTQVRTKTAFRAVTRDVQVTEPQLLRCTEYPQRTLAVHVLAHEAFHLAGIGDEAQTDCYAMQWVGAVGSRLGADPDFAGDTLGWLWSWYQTWQSAKPPEYSSPECRENGGFDLTPGDGRWP